MQSTPRTRQHAVDPGTRQEAVPGGESPSYLAGSLHDRFMDRSVVGVALVVAVGVAATLPAVAGYAGATPVEPQMAGVTNTVEDVERADDGGVVVLERWGHNLRENGDLAIVHVYDDWSEPPTSHQVTNETIPANTSTDLVGLVRAASGGWWLVGADGTAYRFTDDWTYADTTRSVGRQVRAVDRAPDGTVWVATDGGLVAFAPDFETVRHRKQGTAGEAGVDGLEATRGGVWVLARDDLRRYDHVGGGRLRPGDGGRSIHDTTAFRTDLEPAPDGDWLVVDGGGAVHRVTGSLVFTGRSHDVGTDRAYPGTPSDVISLAPSSAAVVWGLGALVVVGLVVGVGLVGWRRDFEPRGYAAAAVVCPGVLLSTYTQPWPLRPLLFALPVPDLVVPLATLLAVGGHLGALRQAGRPPAEVGASAAVYAPLVVAGVLLLGKLVSLL
jgi:hypothetical protein